MQLQLHAFSLTIALTLTAKLFLTLGIKFFFKAVVQL